VRRAAAVAARRCKNARCARVFGPRGALGYLLGTVGKTTSLNNTGTGPPEFLTTLGRGVPKVYRVASDTFFPPSLCLRHFSAPNAPPDTLTPTCLPTSLSEGHSRRRKRPAPATFTSDRMIFFLLYMYIFILCPIPNVAPRIFL